MAIHCDPLFKMIYSYTRKQALENGNLIDVTEQAMDKKLQIQLANTITWSYSYE
ncbi:hypothetical protein [Maridesulfovibrio sp.]|uniref:hypothetical protein n=1 Tax=Maridesulfovibrio sp. TaxID=2795000 RepID=UPI002AA92661|nr:hypothetical protein [Maridesulfovibrio sp.]